jgi:hypothetical protein
MLDRGDRQHDIAAWFGVNSARIGEIAKGDRFRSVTEAPESKTACAGTVRRAGRSVQPLNGRLVKLHVGAAINGQLYPGAVLGQRAALLVQERLIDVDAAVLNGARPRGRFR